MTFITQVLRAYGGGGGGSTSGRKRYGSIYDAGSTDYVPSRKTVKFVSPGGGQRL